MKAIGAVQYSSFDRICNSFSFTCILVNIVHVLGPTCKYDKKVNYDVTDMFDFT